MKQKLLCALLALGMTVSLAACGGKENPGSSGGGTQSAPPSQSVPAASADQSNGPNGAPGVETYAFQTGDTTVYLGEDMEIVLFDLGEPQSYFEAESCAFEGLDKTYTYSGFVITTRPEGEKDYVNSILLTDDSVTTPEGIYIGSSSSDVVAAYGESKDGFETLLTYTKNGTVLNFVLDGGKVISIEYMDE